MIKTLMQPETMNTPPLPCAWIGLRSAIFAVAASIMAQAAQSQAQGGPRSSGAPSSIQAIDLASDTAWVLRCDDGPSRPIKVPGGGWNSDQQSPRIQVMQDVKDHVVYKRMIIVPHEASGQVIQLRFGAVTYGCEVYLDGQKMGEHHGPQVPFEIDITRAVVPGKEQWLEVKAFHRRHYLNPGETKTAEIAVGWDFPEGGDEPSRKEAATWCEWHGNSKVGYGIVRSIKLAILPAVHVQEVFVRPSVANQQLACDVWVRNETGQERKITLAGTLSSWNGSAWKYPAIPSAQVTVPARGTVKARLGPVAWDLGPESYWWPNIPFREEFAPQLHLLELKIEDGSKVWQAYPQRFGFVEHAEGPFYYTVNGVRYTGFSDSTAEGQVSHFDSYSSPAWLPPTGPGTGAPESWRRYMRIGMNMNRLHCSPPTEYMMDAADEVGMLLIPEAPIWGNGLSRYSRQYTPQTLHDMGRASRNHPSVARYSLTNEVRDWPTEWPSAIDDMREVDDIRPLVYELVRHGTGKVTGPKSGSHAWTMDHYSRIDEKVGDGKGIRGMGEHFWKKNSMGEYAVGIRTLRVNGWCYMSGWSWINYWPNFLQGMSHELHAWKPENHADRTDGVDGWGSPIVLFTQRSLHPYLIQDLGVLAGNPGEPRLLASGGIEWPYQMPRVVGGKKIERTVAIFNGGLKGSRLSFLWSAHWDKPDGPVAIPVSEVPLEIEPGSHLMQKLALTVPESGTDQRRLYIVMESRKEGETLFREEGACLEVCSKDVVSAAEFLDKDASTQGNWMNKYGIDGYELAGKESKLPAYAKLKREKGDIWIYDKATDDPRALAYFADPPTGKDRIAASWYGDPATFALDVGTAPRRLSLYFLDYDKKSRRQAVEIFDAPTGRILDRREIGEFTEGCYLTWKIQGSIRVEIRRLAGDNASLNGLFLDAANP